MPRTALRQLARSPAFLATVILTLAVGIGASTLLFSVVNGVLLAPLPYPEPERIVAVEQISERDARIRVSDPNFADLKEQARSFAAFAQYAVYYAPVAGGDEPVRTVVADVSAEFFDVFAVRPALGRTFAPEERVLGAAPVAIVSHDFWQRYLGGTQDFAARTLRFGGRTFTIVGVLPRGFDFPDDASVYSPRESLWPPGGRLGHNFHAVGRLAPGVTVEAARAETSAIARRLKAELGADTAMEDAHVARLQDRLVAAVRLPLLIVSAAAALLYAVAVFNVTNLFLARAVTRERELATRLALGARRSRLALGLFAEALSLAVLGALGGLLAAWWGGRLILLLDPGLLPRASSVRVGGSTAAAALVLAVVAAAAASVLTAWRSPNEAGALRGERQATAGRQRARLRDVLVAVQVAIAVVLVVGATLLGRSYERVVRVDPGFRADGMLLMEAITPYAREEGARIRGFHDRVLQGLRALPGVTAVGAVSSLPLRGAGTNGTFVTLNAPDEVRDVSTLLELFKEPGRSGFAEYRVASEDYFRSLDIPLLRGRVFETSDSPRSQHVAVVSRSLAEATWPGEEPLGKLIQFGGMDGDFTPFTVVGVVGDIRDYGLDRPARPTFYAYYRQRPAFADSLWFAIRGGGTETAAAARAVLRTVDPDVPPRFLTSEQLYGESLARHRFNLVMLAIFGGAALWLALSGIYGAIAFNVAQRTREIGVRMALGARSENVVRMVLRRCFTLVGAGVAGGLVAAFAASRALEPVLYGTASHDPVTYAAATVALLAVAGIAAWLPARHAARVDPMVALRHE